MKLRMKLTDLWPGDNLAAYASRFITMSVIEPGIIEFRCKRCQAGFETDTTLEELLKHLEKHQL